MPVSTPSYFPPNRSNGSVVGITANNFTTGARCFLGGQTAGGTTTAALNDLIVIGDHALSGAVSDTDMIGSTIVGSQAAKVATVFSGPVTVVGFNAYLAAGTGSNSVGNSVIVGDNACANLSANASAQNVVIGSGAMISWPGSADFQGASSSNVMIGYRVAAGTGQRSAFSLNVIVGSLAVANYAGGVGPSVDFSANVILGDQIGARMGESAGTQCVNNVLIGQAGARNLVTCSNSVIVGQTAGATGVTSVSGVVSVGHGATTNADATIAIGKDAAAIGASQIVIGFGANTFSPDSTVGLVLIEGSGQGSVFYGRLSSGNIVLGNSSAAQREFAGVGATNILKLVNGTIGSTNPVNGGYFYVTAGALHWVGSAGTDTPIAPA